MKRLLLAAVFLSGCAGNPPVAPPAVPPVVAPPVEPPAEPPATACNATTNRARMFMSLAMFAGLPRIVGGVDAAIEDFPFMVAITTPSGFQYCGGSLIGPRTVLTAAHCKVAPGDNVIARRSKLSYTGGYRVMVTKAITHADYNPQTNENDASLLTLGDPIPGPYAEIGAAPQAGTATAIGWGLLHESDSRATDTLQRVDVPIVDNVTCGLAYPSLTDGQMCAGDGNGDTCSGDSGGPILFRGQQVGITSYGIGCNRPTAPGVYQRTAAVADWIDACR